MNLKRTLLLLPLFALPTLASTITFGTGGTTGFTGGSVPSVSVNNIFGLTGLNVSVIAGVLAPDSCDTICWVTTSNSGYGVDNSAPAGGASDGSTELDGNGFIDSLTITFSRNVTLTGATFGNFGGADNGSIYNTTSGATLVTNFNNSSLTSLNATGKAFRFSPGSGDSFLLRSITFTDSGASAVPEPGTLGLTGLGLIGLALSRKRKPVVEVQ